MRNQLAMAIGALLVTAAVGCGDDDPKYCDCTCTCDGVDTPIEKIKTKVECDTACDASCAGTWESNSTCAS